MISRADTRTVRCKHCGCLTVPPGQVEDIRVLALRALALDIGGCHDDVWRFFRTLIEAKEPYKSVRTLAYDLGFGASALVSRFNRAGLPRVKQYITYVQAMRIAGARCATMIDATALTNFSCPQSLSRMIRNTFGVAGSDFLRYETGTSVLERFRQDLVLPFRTQWFALRLLPVLRSRKGGPRSRIAA
jgi:hypothetical protein